MNRNPRKALILILAVSVALRVVAAVILGDKVIELPGTADQISYHTLALQVLGGHGFSFPRGWWPITAAGAPTAHWSFLYTFYLVAVYGIFGVHPIIARVLQAIIVGALHPYLAYRIGERVASKTVGLVAAAITAIYAYFIYYSATLMTEPFFITAVMAALYMAIVFADGVRKELGGSMKPTILIGLLLGLVFGAAVLLRQLILLFVPLLFAWILWVALRNRTFWKAVAGLVVAGVVVGAMILPFTLYNYARFGRFVLLNTNSGYAFFWGNNPVYGTHFIPILQDDQYLQMIPTELKTLDEAALDQALMKRGMDYVVSHPKDYALLSLSRIPVYFMFWPSTDSGMVSNLTRIASFGLFLPFMLGGLIVTILRRKHAFWDALASPVFLLILFTGVYTLVHLLSWTLIRYRLPVDAVLLVFASVFLVLLYQLAQNAGSRQNAGDAGR